VYCVVEFGDTFIDDPVRFPGLQVKVPPGIFVVAVNVVV